MKKGHELSIGTGLMAVVNVAIANTISVLTHPVHTAKTIVGLEKDKSIPEMLQDEEARLIAQRSQPHFVDKSD